MICLLIVVGMTVSINLDTDRWMTSSVKEDISYKDCMKECKSDSSCTAFSYFEPKGNKTCMFKGAPSEGLSVAAQNGVFNEIENSATVLVSSWHKLCSERFDKDSSPYAADSAKAGFCGLTGFRLAGAAVGAVIETNSTYDCHAKCTQQGVECIAFTIQDGKCTLYGDTYSVLYCSAGNCYSATKDCYLDWSSTAECLDGTQSCAKTIDLTSKDLLIEYTAHSEMPQRGRKDIFFYKENGDELGALQLHSDSNEKEISLLLTACSKGQINGNLAVFDKNPFYIENELRGFVISINDTGISVSGVRPSLGPKTLLWDDIFATDPTKECSAWNVTEIKKIGFRHWEAYGAMWTTVESRAGIVGLSAVIMLVWAVIMM